MPPTSAQRQGGSSGRWAAHLADGGRPRPMPRVQRGVQARQRRQPGAVEHRRRKFRCGGGGGARRRQMRLGGRQRLAGGRGREPEGIPVVLLDARGRRGVSARRTRTAGACIAKTAGAYGSFRSVYAGRGSASRPPDRVVAPLAAKPGAHGLEKRPATGAREAASEQRLNSGKPSRRRTARSRGGSDTLLVRDYA